MGTSEIIGKNIFYFRTSLGMSQEEVSSFLNVERSTISKYETGEREIPLPVLEKLSDLFGVEISGLLEENNEKSQVNQALAFRKDSISREDLESIAGFQKIVKKYLEMKKILENE